MNEKGKRFAEIFSLVMTVTISVIIVIFRALLKIAD